MMKTTITTILAILLLFITPSLAAANSGNDASDTPVTEGDVNAFPRANSDVPNTTNPTQDPLANASTPEQYVQKTCQDLTNPSVLVAIGREEGPMSYLNWGRKLRSTLGNRYNVNGHQVKGYFYQFIAPGTSSAFTSKNTSIINRLAWFDNSLVAKRKTALEGAKTEYKDDLVTCLVNQAKVQAGLAAGEAFQVQQTAKQEAKKVRDGALETQSALFEREQTAASQALAVANTNKTKSISSVKKNYQDALRRAKSNRQNAISVAKTFPRGSKVRAKAIRKAKRVYNKSVKRAKVNHDKNLKKATVSANLKIKEAQSQLASVRSANQEAVEGIKSTYESSVDAAETAYAQAWQEIEDRRKAEEAAAPGQATTLADEEYKDDFAQVADDRKVLSNIRKFIGGVKEVLNVNRKRKDDLIDKIKKATNGSSEKKKLVAELERYKGLSGAQLDLSVDIQVGQPTLVPGASTPGPKIPSPPKPVKPGKPKGSNTGGVDPKTL